MTLATDGSNYFIDFAARTAPFRFKQTEGEGLARAFRAISEGYADVFKAAPLIERMLEFFPPADPELARRNYGKLVLEEGVGALRVRISEFAQMTEDVGRWKLIRRIVKLGEVPPSDTAFVAEKLGRASTAELRRQLSLLERYGVHAL